jgi:16S rRNA (guanine966-N2)-methyltransferase
MRVIAGTAKGVPLRAPKGVTRPTTDRVREAVFSRLADWAGTGGEPAARQLVGLSLLDLYAGSGAVAIEAMSRGAGQAVCVDSAAPAVAAARSNALAAGLPVDVVRALVVVFLNGAPTPFDIVWLDPPYDLPDEAVDKVIALVSNGWLAPRGLVAVERSARGREPRWPAGLSLVSSRRYGETVVSYAQEDAS